MKRVALALGLAAGLPAGATASAEPVSIGVSAHRHETCVPGTYTGVRIGPDDAFGLEGDEYECSSDVLKVVSRYGGGLVVAIPLTTRLALRLEPGFTSHGYFLPVRSGRELHLDYVQLPVYARLALTTGRVRPYLLGGAFVARRRNEDQTIEMSYVFTDPAHPLVVQRKELWRSWNAGVSVGAGLDVGVGRARLMAEVTLDRGLVDVYGGANLDEHTRAFRIAAGFLIPLGGN